MLLLYVKKQCSNATFQTCYLRLDFSFLSSLKVEKFFHCFWLRLLTIDTVYFYSGDTVKEMTLKQNETAATEQHNDIKYQEEISAYFSDTHQEKLIFSVATEE